jgi:hypothetical protein
VDEMTYGMHFLGINKMEGLANYLYHPEKICAIMEDTGELVPEVELERHVRERLAKEELEKDMLAKEKKLVREKADKGKKIGKGKVIREGSD